MNKLRLLFLVFSIFAIAITLESCKKEDPCENVFCQNGGECVDGTCDCPDGFIGSNCGFVEPCFEVNCQNGGVCENGICDCPDGFIGINCEIPDLCFTVDCQNDGTCINGDCYCPPDWIGEFCETPCYAAFVGTWQFKLDIGWGDCPDRTVTISISETGNDIDFVMTDPTVGDDLIGDGNFYDGCSGAIVGMSNDFWAFIDMNMEFIDGTCYATFYTCDYVGTKDD